MAKYNPDFDLERRYQKFLVRRNIDEPKLTIEDRAERRRQFMMGCRTMLDIILIDMKRYDSQDYNEIIDLMQRELHEFFIKNVSSLN